MSLIEQHQISVKDIQQTEGAVRSLGQDIQNLKRERESLKNSIDSFQQQIKQTEQRERELEQSLSQRRQKLEQVKRELPSHEKQALNEIESLLTEAEQVEKLRLEFEQRFTTLLERLSASNSDASSILGNRFVQNFPNGYYFDTKKMSQIPHLIVDRNSRSVTVKFI